MLELEERNKALVRRFVDALNQHNLDALDDLVAPDFVRHCQATPGLEIRSLAGFKRFLVEDHAGVPDGRQIVRFLIAEGDFAAMYCTYSGTQTGQWGPFSPTGRHVEFDFSGVIRFCSGKMAELWITWDNLIIMTQLGFAPLPAAAKA
jgi:predicted ester cyclase